MSCLLVYKYLYEYQSLLISTPDTNVEKLIPLQWFYHRQIFSDIFFV